MATHCYGMDKADCLVRLRKIEGQVRGLQRMVDEEADCIDVLTQFGSVCAALRSVAVGLTAQHLRRCVEGAAASTNGNGDASVAEATRTIERLLKL